MDEGKDEENNNEASAGSWWGSWPTWLQAAKEKSSTALEFMKRDLSEFSHVVQTDAVAAVSSTAALLKEKLTIDNAELVADKARQSITSVLETITDAFVPQKELEDAELMVIKNSEPVVMDWWQSQLYMIRKDPKTFCHEPEGPPEMYENWLESFDPSEYEDEMTRIMMSCSEVQELYDKLVPSSVSHLEFWQRYFYRVHLLRKAETKRADLMRRAEQISIADVEWNENTSGEIKNSAHIHNTEKFAASVLKAEDAERNAVNSNVNQVTHSPYRSELTRESAQSIPAEVAENDTDAKKTLKINEHIAVPNISSTDHGTGNVEKTVTEVLSETTDIQTELSSEDSTDGSRLSPVESLGKDCSTSDEWEKDFDLELSENDLNTQGQNHQLQKENEDDWETWQ